MTREDKSNRRKPSLKSGALINLFVAMMIVFFATAMRAPAWAPVTFGFVVWLVLEVHRDLLSAIEHQKSDKAD